MEFLNIWNVLVIISDVICIIINLRGLIKDSKKSWYTRKDKNMNILTIALCLLSLIIIILSKWW
jgi:NADH:ubiquinone oxidoreductase subunit 6 (subunit J)